MSTVSLRLALALTMAVGVHGAFAAEPSPQVRAALARPTQLDGTIVAVNPKLRVITVDVNGKLLTVNVTRQLKISRDGKPVGFEQLTAGQTVNLTFVELADGHLEVAQLSIASTPEGLEAAGPKGEATRRVPTLPPQAPFTSPPNPANVSGNVVSKHK